MPCLEIQGSLENQFSNSVSSELQVKYLQHSVILFFVLLLYTDAKEEEKEIGGVGAEFFLNSNYNSRYFASKLFGIAVWSRAWVLSTFFKISIKVPYSSMVRVYNNLVFLCQSNCFRCLP